MASAIFFQALRDYMRAKRLAPWLLLATVGFLMALAWSLSDKAGDPADQYSAISYILVFRVLALSAAILATANISAEVEQKTIVYLLTRPVPRWMLLVMRYLAASLVVFLVSAFCAIVVSLTVFHGRLSGNPMLVPDLEALALGAFAYCGLFTLISLMLNRAMIYSLLIAFGWESSVPQMPGTMYYISIFSHLQALTHHPVKAEGTFVSLLAASLGTNTISPSVALIVLVSVAVGSMALGIWWFTHFEYVPREDEA